MTILRSTGPVISTRRSRRSGGGGATVHSPSRTDRVPGRKSGFQPASSWACTCVRRSSISRRRASNARCKPATNPSAPAVKIPSQPGGTSARTSTPSATLCAIAHIRDTPSWRPVPCGFDVIPTTIKGRPRSILPPNLCIVIATIQAIHIINLVYGRAGAVRTRQRPDAGRMHRGGRRRQVTVRFRSSSSRQSGTSAARSDGAAVRIVIRNGGASPMPRITSGQDNRRSRLRTSAASATRPSLEASPARPSGLARQPSVSLQVQVLEQELKVSLFQRRGPRITLTPDGQGCTTSPGRSSRRSTASRPAFQACRLGLETGRLNIPPESRRSCTSSPISSRSSHGLTPASS